MNAGDELYVCNNCGQPVQKTDSSCWHCGAALNFPKLDTQTAAEESSAPVSERTLPLLQTVFYAAMTILTLAALLLVINSLGQQPRLTASFEGSDVPTVNINGTDGSFSINLPSDLIWYLPNEESSRRQEARQMLEDPEFYVVLQPFAERAPDVELLLLARAESGILSLARSERLGGISVQDFLAYAAGSSSGDANVINMHAGNGLDGEEIAILTVEQLDAKLVCRQHIIPRPERTYMAALCSEQQIFEEQSSTFAAILDSLVVR